MRLKFYFSLSVALLIIVVNYYASIYQVYYLIPYFDIPMHIMGGLMTGLFAQVGIDFLNNHKINKKRFMWVLLGVIVVGVVWEFVEFYMGLTDGLGPISRLDTIKDLVDDIIGGVLSIWLWKFLFNKNKNS